MKAIKLLTIAVCAFAWLGISNVRAADEKKPCCDASVEAGKKCEHACCKKAADKGKVCKKCHPAKTDDKK